MNAGHGHVYPRPDGAKARCGGPGLCSVCSQDLAQLTRSKLPVSPPKPVVVDVWWDERVEPAPGDIEYRRGKDGVYRPW